MNIGIISKEAYKKRTIAIAKGEYKPQQGEPKIWFESMDSMANVLSNKNQELLKLIVNYKPDSIKELEKISGITDNNLIQKLNYLARYGIVELKKSFNSIKPIVKVTDFQINFNLL